MADIFELKETEGRFTFTAWTQDINSARALLFKTLQRRGLPDMPKTEIRLSDSLYGSKIRFHRWKSPERSLACIDFESDLKTEPLFFENKIYQFEITFTTKPEKVQVVHPLLSVGDAFRYRSSNGTLLGSINFNNDIGWFKFRIQYELNGKHFDDSISWEVFPLKMAMTEDLEKIHTIIDQVYPLWRFSFIQKTDQELARSRKPHERFLILWLAQFKSLLEKLENAVKMVLKQPHTRLLPEVRYCNANRLKGRLTARMEEQILTDIKNGQDDLRYMVEVKKLKTDTPENRFVKMVLVRSTRELFRFTENARRMNDVPNGGKLSNEFFTELENWRLPFERSLSNPFFKCIQEYTGMEHESLVLHNQAGYANVYRVWQDLKCYLDLFGKQAQISVRSVSELYEIWCFLELHRILLEVGFQEVVSVKPRLRNSGFQQEIIDGQGAAFVLQRGDITIRLSHEPVFSTPNDPAFNRIYSFTTPQKPDILLEVLFEKENEILRWIFDAKYRLDLGRNNDVDRVPDDAINQMHRYRDALIHLSQDKTDYKAAKTRPVIGAFILYPGFFDEKNGQNPYSSSIEAVGIGAFPLLPGSDNLWIKAFLHKSFGTSIYSVPIEPDIHLLEESVRIPPTGLQLFRYNDLVIAAGIGSKRILGYIQKLGNGQAEWYHIPCSTTDKKVPRGLVRELKYYVPVFAEGIKVIYEINQVEMKKRSELTTEQTGTHVNTGEADYWLFHLSAPHLYPDGKLFETVGRPFKYKFFRLENLLSASSWEDISENYNGIT